MKLAFWTYKTTPLSHSLPLPAMVTTVQNSATYTDSTNKTPRKLQIDHGPRKTGPGTTVQQEHQSATKS